MEFKNCYVVNEEELLNIVKFALSLPLSNPYVSSRLYAIKILRYITDWDLGKSKDYVDKIRAKQNKNIDRARKVKPLWRKLMYVVKRWLTGKRSRKTL